MGTGHRRPSPHSIHLGRTILRASRAVARRSLGRSACPADIDEHTGNHALAVCERLLSHDPELAPLGAFCHVVARSAAANLWRHETAGRRDCRLTDSFTDADEIRTVDDGSALCPDADLHLDLCTVVGTLPPQLLAVCEGLAQHPKEEVARHLRISKAKLYRDIRKIRAVFVDRGLDTYVSSHD